MNGENESEDNQPTPNQSASPPAHQVERSAPPTAATNKQLQAIENKIDQRMSDFERSTIWLTRVALVIASVAAIFNCLQWIAMRETLDEIKTSGNTSANQLWQAIGNMNWMARTADGSLHEASRSLDESIEASKRQTVLTAEQISTMKNQLNQMVTDKRPWLEVVPQIDRSIIFSVFFEHHHIHILNAPSPTMGSLRREMYFAESE